MDEADFVDAVALWRLAGSPAINDLIDTAADFLAERNQAITVNASL